MIGRPDIVERVAEWQLTEEVIEKDYLLGWLLWGIGADPVLGDQWVFKGGTCLKKCYIETYRFSEDLDFTVLPGGPYLPEQIEPHLGRVLARVHDASGIDFSARAPLLRLRPDALSVEGRVYYVGPRQTPQPARVKLDISANETVIRPPVLREIAHPLPRRSVAGRVRCYSFEELFAEKIRAMAQRARPRDLYDIINLFRRNDLRLYPDVIRQALVEKCAAKELDVPTASDFVDSPLIAALEADWSQMLGHQLPALPPLEGFFDELPLLFAWLEGTAEFEELAPLPGGTDEGDWSPPPTVTTWRTGIPLETVRFAATNHLCVELLDDGSWRRIEPYSLRRSSSGRLLLHAERSDGEGHRTYGVDKIGGLRVTTVPFRPRYPIEFSAHGPLHAPPQSRNPAGWGSGLRRASPRSATGPVHIYQCTRCGKEFRHTKRNATLRAHKDPYGFPCPGRRGIHLGPR
ncbi:MAG: nucleotidyl transferase AbiEii/AbiGii toxin family protein [Actinomycetota bacterium]|nr:nucleotidyl transferase AbiEii/AbiGii toxin family protein [Actinomycetota bacterium]